MKGVHMAEKKAAQRTAAKTAGTAEERQNAKAASQATAGALVGGDGGPHLADRAAVLAVRPDEAPWSTEELQTVCDRLQDEVDRLREEIASAEAELVERLRDGGEGAGDDQADAGSKTFEREHEMSLAANARDLLNQAEHAMTRIKDGTYGTCEGCGRPIGKARLLAFPRATLCVACKQQEERR